MKFLRVLFLTILFGTLCYQASAQSFIWEHSGGGVSNDGVTGIAVDAAGNSYVTGSFMGAATFGSTVLTSAGGLDVFVVKYDASGAVVYAVSGGGASDDAARSIAVDAAGNAYVAGQYYGTSTYAPLSPITSLGGSDVFVLKVDPSGVFVNLFSAGGVSSEDVQSIAVEAAGAVYIAGMFTHSATFGTLTLNANGPSGDSTSAYNQDAFFVKYDAAGTAVWARAAGGTTNDYATTVCIDEVHGAVYFSGLAKQATLPIVFGSGGTPLTWSGSGVFLARYSSVGGNIAWVQQESYFAVQAVVTASGDVCIAGSGGLVLIDGTSGTTVHTSSIPGTITGLAFNALDNSFLISGSFNGTMIIGPSTLTSLMSAVDSAGHTSQSQDGFVAQYDNLFTPLFGVAMGGQLGDAATGVGVDGGGGIYVAGYFTGTSTFGPLTPITAAGGTDAFVVKISAGNWITGDVYRDLDNSGHQNSGETGFAGVTVQVTSTGTSVLCATNAAGHYAAPVGSGTFTITIPTPPPHYTITSLTLNATFGAPYGLNATGKDFPFVPVPNMHDVRVTLTPITAVREGRSTTYFIVYENRGTTTEAGSVTLTYDAHFTFNSSTPTPDASAAPLTATWNYTSLVPGEVRQISAVLDLPVGVVVGTIVTCKADITGLGTDETPDDNTSGDVTAVVNSHDPNDKQVLPSGNYSPQQIAAGPTMRYIIRFQNTGNAEAIDISVRDTLDPNLIAGTMQTLATSHPCTVSITAGGAIQWTFHDINLADSMHDETHSHGFITYSVQPRTSLRLNDSIRNKAAIYFDFNAPVVTNTTITRVAPPVILTRRDSITSRSFIFADRNVIGKQFAIYNTKFPASPVQSIDISIVPVPTKPAIAGDLTIDGNLKSWSLPSAHIDANPLMTDSLVFSCGVPDSANWTGHVEIVVHHLDGDSLVLITGTWSASLAARRADSLHVASATFDDPHVVGRTFTVRNSKRPASNIIGVNIALQPSPRFSSVGQSLLVDGVGKSWFDAITPSTPARDSIQFELGLIDSSNWTGSVHVHVYHANGDSSDLVYGPWTVTSVGVHERGELIDGFGLIGVEPAPATNDASIHFAIGSLSHATLDIVSASGRIVATITDGMLESGTHAERVHTQELPAGNYWVRLRTSHGVFSAPLVVTH